MATTTTNFGWDIPQSTDLVKDGATAIAALGQDIDTALVDLKGGTTGQILAKASNTDLDYSWITNDVGDITAVTAGTGITGGGTSGAVTVSFDQANFGGGQWAAGKNKIINGDFGVWQRGTSISTTTGASNYGADRFRFRCDFSAGTSTFTQQTFTPGTAPVAGYEGQFFGRLTCGSTSTYANITHRIEDVRTLAAQTATLSYWAKASAAITLTPTFAQNFGSGGSGTVFTFGTAVTLTTSWVRYTTTVSVPSITGKTIGTTAFLEILFELANNLNSATIDLWGVQVEAANTASNFQTATGTKQGELAACQRYYQKSYNQGTTVPTNTTLAGAIYGTLTSAGNNAAWLFIKLPVVMRTAPAVTMYSYTSSTANVISNYAGTDQAAGSCTAQNMGDSGFYIANISGGTVTTTGGFLVHYAASSEL
jgi:hypothetical protein